MRKTSLLRRIKLTKNNEAIFEIKEILKRYGKDLSKGRSNFYKISTSKISLILTSLTIEIKKAHTSRNSVPSLENDSVWVRSTTDSDARLDVESSYKQRKTTMDEEEMIPSILEEGTQKKLSKKMIGELIAKHNKDANATSWTSCSTKCVIF